jgi:hypothetical protein
MRIDQGAEHAPENEVEPLLIADHKGVLEATTILAELNRRHPERFGESQLRTLQRRVRQWRALNVRTRKCSFHKNILQGAKQHTTSPTATNSASRSAAQRAHFSGRRQHLEGVEDWHSLGAIGGAGTIHAGPSKCLRPEMEPQVIVTPVIPKLLKSNALESW